MNNFLKAKYVIIHITFWIEHVCVVFCLKLMHVGSYGCSISLYFNFVSKIWLIKNFIVYEYLFQSSVYNFHKSAGSTLGKQPP